MVEQYLIFGGTGSLGTTLVRRLLEQKKNVAVFSRDEAKHHKLQQQYPSVWSLLGDIRDYDAVVRAIHHTKPTHIINAAALKQVPICEEHPYEAVMTNIVGSQNLVRAVEELYPLPSEYGIGPMLKVLSISTDKACKPVNSYGMTKALQERIHLNSNACAVFNCVRYGNVLESTGSVIPVFKSLIEQEKDLTVTDVKMTRFFLSLDQAVDLIFKALSDSCGKKVYIPIVPSAKILDLAEVMSEGTNSDVVLGKIRPGEKIDEILVSEEEACRTQRLDDDTYIIRHFYGFLPSGEVGIKSEYSSKDDLMTEDQLRQFLKDKGVI